MFKETGEGQRILEVKGDSAGGVFTARCERFSSIFRYGKHIPATRSETPEQYASDAGNERSNYHALMACVSPVRIEVQVV